MGRSKVHLTRRNAKIATRYAVLSGKRSPKGKPVHSFAYIIEQLSDEFYLSEERIMKILRENT